MNICGNIYVAKDIKSFSLRCTLCEKSVQEWKDFVCHIQGFHGFVEDDEEALDDLNEVWIEEDIKQDTASIKKEQTLKEPEFLIQNDENVDSQFISWSMDDECPMPSSPKSPESETRADSINSESDGDNDHDVDNSSNRDLQETITEVIPEILKLNPTFYVRNPSTTQFIELYKASPCLWNPTDVSYQNSPVRLEAQQKIIDQMKQTFNIILTQRSLKGAIMKIRRQYHTTLQMKNKSKAKINVIVQEHFDKCSFLSVFDNSPEDITIESNTMKFLVFEEVNEATLSFIDAFASHPALYNRQHVDFKSHIVRRRLRGEIAQRLNTLYDVRYTEEDVQKDICKLQSWYYTTTDANKNRNVNSPQSQEAAEAQELYVNKLSSFLPPKLVNQRGQQKLHCDICRKIFLREMTLKLHKYKEHNIGEKPFKCPDCDRYFQVMASLKDHKRRCHMEKSHQCEYCESRFAVFGDLQRHVKTHTGEKRYVCEFCGKPFALITQLKAHTVMIHTKIRAYKCTMCPKDFLRNVHLKEHIKAHLNIRDKICETCGKGFTNCHSLIRHRQIHSEVKKFACKLCDARFHQFVGLNSHMKRTHNIAKSKAN